jgi:spoIIIJ-associated protein
MNDNGIKQHQIDFIQKTASEILGFMGVFCEFEFRENVDGAWLVLKSSSPSILIGDGGQNLASLNHVVQRIFEKKFPDGPRFLIDVNDYHKKHIDEIKDMARMHAQRVRYFKKEAEMRPMSAYDRRLVHMVLQEYPDITTESRGDGHERKVIIKPFDMVS